MSPAETTTGPPTVSSEKKGEKAPIIELKNGKVICRQKPVSFEKQSETLQEIVRFREMLEERIEARESPLSEIPEEHRPVIVKLAHESDKGLTALAKHVRLELLPVQDDDDEDRAKRANDSLPPSVVEAAISSIMERNNYGLEAPALAKLPAALAAWRWEVRDEFKDWLPKSARDKAEARLEERKQAKQALLTTFQALPQSEQDALFSKGGELTKKIREANKTPVPSNEESEKELVESAKKKGKKNAEPENDNDATPKPKKEKTIDPEKAAKEKERLEKKAAKIEKDQKAKEAQNKSRSIMANFFAKAKPVPSAPSPGRKASSSTSEFDKVFKPFVLKKDAVLAPTNWFKAPTRSSKRSRSTVPELAEVIVIDEEEDCPEDIEMLDSTPSVSEAELRRMSDQDRLNSIISSLPPPLDPSSAPRGPPPYGYRVYHPTSVREIVSQLSEAEVAGDDSLVRVLLSKLRDRDLLPAKVFIFREDARPGYFGTWTRSSKVIGPRRPFAKDLVVFDYGYDSGEEWEEEPVGEDVAEDNDDEEEGEDADSDADSWLVDDDEEPEFNLRDIDSLDAPDIFDMDVPPPITAKRKADDGEKKLGKKRKVVVPLVPFAKGPCWEETIGECSYEPFQSYRIQLFNDTPFPIDPFSYVSTCVEDYRDWRTEQNKPADPPIAPVATTNGGFAVPPLPPRLNGAGDAPNATCVNTTAGPSTSTTSTTQTQPRKPIKNPFPDSQLPRLLNKMLQIDTGSFPGLVALVHEDFKDFKGPEKVTKASIEAKIKEVGEKVNKKWTVKAGFMGLCATPNGIKQPQT